MRASTSASAAAALSPQSAPVLGRRARSADSASGASGSPPKKLARPATPRTPAAPPPPLGTIVSQADAEKARSLGVGLTNIGSSCYLAAGTQALLRVGAFRRALISLHFHIDASDATYANPPLAPWESPWPPSSLPTMLQPVCGCRLDDLRPLPVPSPRSSADLDEPPYLLVQQPLLAAYSEQTAPEAPVAGRGGGRAGSDGESGGGGGRHGGGGRGRGDSAAATSPVRRRSVHASLAALQLANVARLMGACQWAYFPPHALARCLRDVFPGRFLPNTQVPVAEYLRSLLCRLASEFRHHGEPAAASLFPARAAPRAGAAAASPPPLPVLAASRRLVDDAFCFCVATHGRCGGCGEESVEVMAELVLAFELHHAHELFRQERLPSDSHASAASSRGAHEPPLPPPVFGLQHLFRARGLTSVAAGYVCDGKCCTDSRRPPPAHGSKALTRALNTLPGSRDVGGGLILHVNRAFHPGIADSSARPRTSSRSATSASKLDVFVQFPLYLRLSDLDRWGAFTLDAKERYLGRPGRRGDYGVASCDACLDAPPSRQRSSEYEEVIHIDGPRHTCAFPPASFHYVLRGVVEHQGATPRAGHYIAYLANSDGTWSLANDALVSIVELSVVLAAQAEVLVYEYVDGACPVPPSL